MRDSVDILKSAGAIAESVLAPSAEEIDRLATYPTDGLTLLGEQGFWGLTIAPEFGGLGANLLTTTQVIEKLAEACPSTAMCFKMHLEAINPMKELATKEQADLFLRPIAEGTLFAGVAANEPGRGPGNIASLAIQGQAGNFLLENCHKSFVTSAHFANIFSLLAKHDPETSDITSFLVNRETPDCLVTVENTWSGLGMRGNDSCAMTFSGSIPKSSLIDKVGGWRDIRSFHVPFVFITYAAVYLGIANGAFRHMIQGIRARHNSPSNVSEVVRRHIGESRVMLEATRSLLYRSASKVDEGLSDLSLCMASSVSADETALKVADTAMLLGGGGSYAKHTPVERYLRDAYAGRIMVPQDEQTKLNLGTSSLDTV